MGKINTSNQIPQRKILKLNFLKRIFMHSLETTFSANYIKLMLKRILTSFNINIYSKDFSVHVCRLHN